ncbi:MAG: ATP synthase subunit I [Gammaproteobacteria bacterium]
MQDQPDNIINKAVAYRLLIGEAILTAIVSCSLFIGFDKVMAYSAACGGLAYIVPNFLFARFAFRYSAADSPSLAVKWLYIGEAIKLLLTALLFALIITHIRPLNFVALILTFAAMLFINLYGLAYLNRHN